MKVRELLSGPEKWTKGDASKDAKGNLVRFDSKDAVSYCLIGAIYKCYFHQTKEHNRVMDKVYDKLASNFNRETISGWNDSPERIFEDIRQLVEELDI